MWNSRFASINKEIICDRIGKEPYSKDLTSLIIRRIDLETTFMHHNLPEAIDFLRELFGDIYLGDSYSSAMRVLKKYYKEGNKLKDEYLAYVSDLGSINMSDELLWQFLEEKEKNEEGFNASYGQAAIAVYEKYKHSLFKIVKLDEEIENLKEEEKDVGPKGKKGSMRILDYFKGRKSNIK